jgi:hypothetical protein
MGGRQFQRGCGYECADRGIARCRLPRSSADAATLMPELDQHSLAWGAELGFQQ